MKQPASKAVWFCPLCYTEGHDPKVRYCPEDGGPVRPIQERGAEWIGKTLAGKYKVVQFIGAGGMANVFEVERLPSGKRLALKILNPMATSYEGVNERFRQEAMLISLIAHPNVVALYDFGTLDNQANYMVMELLRGQTLKEALEAGPVGAHTACRIIMQTAEGMAAAHERSVIHRDLKPDNLFLQKSDQGSDPMVKILDLGIGKLYTTTPQKGLTIAGTVLGTPEYMSPEQCNGDTVGEPSDIYSLGVVLYELLLGRRPFQDGSYLMILAKHVTETPVWPRDIAAKRGLPDEAEHVVMRALEKNAGKRQESMLAFQRDVAGILSRLRHGERYSLNTPSPAPRPTSVPSTPRMTMAPLETATGANHEVVNIGQDTYWVGRRHGDKLECNAYLRVFRRQKKAISLLIDPGPPRDLDMVAAKIASVIGGVDKLDYIFINHQDPDVAGSVSAIQQMNPTVSVICSEDTWRLARHLGLDPKRYISTESIQGSRLRIDTGHHVQLIPTPFCHFRGAVMLYDPATRILFSGDLFGGTTTGESFVADRSSRKGIAEFHEIYMPSHKALRRAVEAVRQLAPSPAITAPQHGAILVGTEQQQTMDHLLDLELGIDLIEANERDPHAIEVANDMLTAYGYIAGDKAVAALLDRYTADGSFSSVLTIQAPNRITGFRIDPRLAIETLLLDMSRSVPSDQKQRLTEHLLPLRAKLTS